MEPGIELAPIDGGRACVVAIRAQPGAKRSGLSGLWNGHVKVAVRAPAQDGRANAEVIEVLAAALGLARGQLELLHGERARLKRVRVACEPAAVLTSLHRALGLG